MPASILATKLYIPKPRPKIVLRSRLIEKLNGGLASGHQLTLISAAAGFGKTTLVSDWAAACGRAAAWLSLDAEDNDPTHFLTYLIAALQTIAPNIGEGVVGALQSPQAAPIESVLTSLLNEITAIAGNFILVLDDYHAVDSEAVDHVLIFLLDHLPRQMHLVISTREDPNLPLARLRARDLLTELRITDLRFTSAEAAEFLNTVMVLNLQTEDLNALEARTEGWIAGLQLAAISMQGHQDVSSFIKSFTGSHHFVLDYLVEEVLQQQPASVQTFLLCTSILDRMCGPLCDALLHTPAGSGQNTLEYIESANLFIIPLDSQRQWYRYHHLFADLLRQRLPQSITLVEDQAKGVDEYHIRASIWYEENGLKLEAFHHAAAADDVERAERLIDEGLPLTSRDGVISVLSWLGSLSAAVLDAKPSLRVTYASLLLVTGQTAGVQEKLDAAESALQRVELDEKTRDLIGQISSARATLALSQYQVEAIFVHAQRALEHLSPQSLSSRMTAYWTLGFAHQFKGDRSAAGRAYAEALAISSGSGNTFLKLLAAIGLGNIQEADNQLDLAVQTYRQVVDLFGDHPQSVACEPYLGLARISYEWNDFDAALKYGQQSVQLAHLYENNIDRFVIGEIFLARLKLMEGDAAGAAQMLAQSSQTVRQNNFMLRVPEVAAAQVLVMLQQGNITSASELAHSHNLPLSQARVDLAKGHPAEALTTLLEQCAQMESRNWADERLRAMVLQVVALHALGEKEKAMQVLSEVLILAEPGGFIRIFLDEGRPLAELLTRINASSKGTPPAIKEYIRKLLGAFENQQNMGTAFAKSDHLIEPLSERELEVLRLIAQGLSNHQISERLFLALSTVKGHNRIIFNKLQVRRRTEAIVRARELGLL